MKENAVLYFFKWHFFLTIHLVIFGQILTDETMNFQ